MLGEFFGTTLFKAISSSTIIILNRSLSFIKCATFSIQFSFAVRSSSTVAAGYLVYIRSLCGYMNRSTISITLERCLERIAIPSGWHAHNSKILATDLYSLYSIGVDAINLIRFEKISAFMNKSDNASYNSRSLNSNIVSIMFPINYSNYFFSDRNC